MSAPARETRNVDSMRDDPERLLEVSEAAALLHVKTKTLYAWVSRNKIPYRKICFLKWFDLDFDRAVIHVRKTKTKLNRVVPMNGRVKEVFNKQKRSSEYVFTSAKTNGRLMDVKKAFNTARKEAGIPDFQLRDLRHSCATRLSDRGEELVTVSEILGHTDIRMTKRYSHGMHERKRQALEKLVSFTPRQNHVKT